MKYARREQQTESNKHVVYGSCDFTKYSISFAYFPITCEGKSRQLFTWKVSSHCYLPLHESTGLAYVAKMAPQAEVHTALAWLSHFRYVLIIARRCQYF